jgi:sterol desaturase/sphingolipid hydroxylase (fatty acid hydroxylase superfamily)
LISPVELAIPVFSGAMVLESLVSVARRDGRYGWKDTFANVAVGWGNVLVNLGWVLLTYALFSAIYRYAPHHLPTHAIWAWSLLFVLEDLCYYGFHRVSHRSRLLWAAHVVHHSSNRYNLSTAVRQTWTHGLLGWVFWTPLAALGFHPFAIMTMQAFSLIYQFFLHTPYVGDLGPLGWVLNTPAHHRVHHGVNEEYLDKNYGGVLIVWDRLFGTFEPERAPVRYGITKPLVSYNPFVIALAEYGAIARDLVGARGVMDRVGFLLGEPAFRPGRRLWSWNVAAGRRFTLGGALVTVMVLAALSPAMGAVGEAWLRRSVATELADERDRCTAVSGVLEEQGVLPGGALAVSHLAYRAPDALRIDALSPAEVAGDVLALEGGTLDLYSRRENVDVRIRNVPREDASTRRARIAALVDRSVRDHAFASEEGTLLGRAVVRWTATPFEASGQDGEARVWLDRELGWPLRVEWRGYAMAFREIAWVASGARFEPPASANRVEWDLGSKPLTRGEAAAVADFPVLEPASRELALPRIVKAEGHWPPRLALVYEAPPFFAMVALEKERGVAPSRGLPVALGGTRALVGFAGDLVSVSFTRGEVSVVVLGNLPAPEVLRFAATIPAR